MSYHGNTIGLNEGSSSFESASTILYPTFSDLSVNLQMELAKSSGYTVRQLIIANIPVCFEACEIELKAIEELTASLRKSNFKASPPSSQKKEDLIIQIGSCGRRFWNNYIYKPIAGPKAIQLGYVFKFEKALDELLRVYINKTTPPVNLAAAQKAWVDTTPNILKVISQNAELARERAEGVRYIPGKRMAPMDPEKLDTVELGESLTFFQRLNQIALHVSPNPEFNIVFAMTQALSVGISSPNFFDGLTSGEVKTEVRSVLNEASKWASLMEGYFYNNPGGSFHRDILLTVLNNDKVSAAAREDPESHL
ncbi:uncharacterized protein SAPINGB_P000292 [Magnusiomyces paraingens]|uniref:Uncharacterized protein n=1 Tax=Magnusiomyces paraingens TaxID=2606893 RepID=A0A5E8B5B0_9ASCO|nr:uncharacterized protein SAPINGB_P000292 [Saprochaete ingens]VVT44080.1 unnamed protein product [Saprochaete ingens]